jgi:hypothetical protein
MTVKYGLYGVQIGATLIGGITGNNFMTGSEVRGEPTSDEIYARFQSLVAQKMTVDFTTLAVSSALTACGLTGVSLGTSALTFHAQKHTSGGSRAGESSHRKYACATGLLVPTRLTCDHQGDASLSYAATLISSDGSTTPVTITEDQTLPAGIDDDERFTLGDVTIEEEVLTSVKSLDIDFGIEVVSEGAGSDILDTFVSIQAIQPTLRLTGIDPLWLKSDAVPITGLNATHANTSIVLRKRSDGGGFAGANDITISAAGLARIEQGFSAPGGGPATCSLVMPLVYDGTNAPITFS